MYDGKTQFLIKNLLNRYDNPKAERTWKPRGIVKAN